MCVRDRDGVARTGRHVSCLIGAAKILVAEAEENNLDTKVDERWTSGAMQPGKTVPRRRGSARVGMLEDIWGGRRRLVSDGCDDRAWERFSAAGHHEDALSVSETQLLCCSALATRRGNAYDRTSPMLATAEQTPGGSSDVASLRRASDIAFACAVDLAIS